MLRRLANALLIGLGGAVGSAVVQAAFRGSVDDTMGLVGCMLSLGLVGALVSPN